MRKYAWLLILPLLALLAWLLLHQPEPDRPQPELAPSAAETRPDLAAALDGAEVDRVSEGTASVSLTGRPVKVGAGRFGLYGRVVDEAERPVPNAWVAAYSTPFPLVDFEFDIEEIFRKPLDLSLEPLASAFADAEGNFQLQGVPGRSVYLVARTYRRLTPGRQRVLPEDLERPEGVMLRTVAGADLQGTVVDAEGRPVAGAEVLVAPGIKYLIQAFRNRHFFAERVFTDGAGHFSVEAVPAGFSLAAAAFDGAVKSGLTEFGPLSAGGSAQVAVRLDVLGGLSGEVVTNEERPAAGAMVIAVPLDLRRIVPFVRNPAGWAATSDGQGKYRFAELPHGQYLLLAQGRQGRSAPLQAGVMGEGSLAPQLVLDTKSVVRGRVLDAKGEPVAGAKVQLMSIPSDGIDTDDEEALMSQSGILFQAAQEILPELLPDATWARTESDGSFTIPAWRRARLRVSAPGYVTADYGLREVPKDKQPLLLLHQPGAVEGVVLDAGKNRPVQFYLVRAEAKRLAGQEGDDEAALAELGYAEEPQAMESPDRGDAQRQALERDFAALAAAVRDDEHVLLPENSWRAQIQASAFCDREDGQFRIDGLAPGVWTLQVQAVGYANTSSEGVAVRSGETTKGVSVVLDRGASVRGRVVAKGSGEPVANAMVTVGRGEELGFTAMLQGLDQSTALGETEADGSFFLAGAREGDDHVNVSAGGYAAATVPVPPLQKNEERADLLIELSLGGSIEGFVQDRHGAVLPGRMVGAFSMQARDFQQTATDERGFYRMEHLRPGSYFLLTAGLDDESLFTGNFMSILNSSRILTAYVAEGEVSKVDIVDTAAGGCRLRGKVVKNGTPVAGARLAVFGTERSGLLDFRLSTAQSGEFGEFEFKNLAPGEYLLNVESKEWDGQLELEVDDVPEDYRVIEVPRTEVRGLVVAAGAETPVPNATVRLIREDGIASSMFGMFGGPGGGAESKWAQTDERGEYRFEGVSPGRYRIEVSGQRMWGRENEGAVPLGRAEVESFELSDNEIKQIDTIRVPIAGNIEVAVADSAGRQLERGFRLRAVPLAPAEEQAGGEEEMEGFGWGGSGQIRGLAAGEYRVEVEAEGYAVASQSPVAVRAGETTRIQVTVQRGATLNLRLLDANNRPIGDAKVELLDRDGQQVNRDQGFGAAFARLFGGNEDGSYELGTFAPGSYTLRVTWEERTRESMVSLIEGEVELAEVRF